jgi:hypothetical protein
MPEVQPMELVVPPPSMPEVQPMELTVPLPAMPRALNFAEQRIASSL